MEYRRYTRKINIICVSVMIYLIYTVRCSQGNNACPKITGTNYSVIHMCKDEVISDIQGFYLDVFVTENRSIICNCSLHSTQKTQIGFLLVQDSQENCKSTLTVKEAENKVTFICKSRGNKTTYKHVIEKGYFLQFKSDLAPVKSTLCINFYNTGGLGSFTVQCYSPLTNNIISTSTVATSNPLVSDHKMTPYASRTSQNVFTTTGKQMPLAAQDFPVVAVGGAAGGLVLVTVVVVLVVVFVKRNRGQRNNQQSEIDYYNIDPDTRAPKNNETNKRPEEIVTDVELIRNDLYYEGNSVKSVNCPSDDYATVEDEATTIESKSNEDNLSKALKSKQRNRNDYDNVEGETSLDDNAGMYAKVNKNKKGKTDKKTGEENVTAQSDLYAVVDKTKKKNRLPAKTAPSSDVYTFVQKPDKSKEKDAENISGDIYSEVKKPKKQEKNISEDEVSGNI